MISIAVGLLALYLAYLALEAGLHAFNRAGIPIRVHVNGIRGKSSVTRLIAAGLRAGGIPTVAKTTGTLPRLIDFDGTDQPIARRGPANLIEQAEVFAWARRHGARALVIECMAVQPRLQHVAEHQFVHATIGVITNVRADHLDVMGPTTQDVARALSHTVPTGATLITAEADSAHRAILAAACSRRHTRFIAVAPGAAPTDLVDGFGHVEHPDNVALALAVCAHLGVPPDVALPGMRAAPPDPGALRVTERHLDEGRLQFVNALAANDPDSTRAIWARVVTGPQALVAPGAGRVVLVNTRRDRQHRSWQLADLLPDLPADAYLVTGGGALPVVRRAAERGIPSNRLLALGDAPLAAVLAALRAQFPPPERGPATAGNTTAARLPGTAPPCLCVFAIGNVGGIGLELMEHLQERPDDL